MPQHALKTLVPPKNAAFRSNRTLITRTSTTHCKVNAPLFYLVKLQHIEQVKELAILFTVFQLGVVLLQAVEGKFGLVIHKHFHGLQNKTESQMSKLV